MPRVPVVPTQQLNPQGPAQYSAPGVVPVQDQSPRQAMAMGEAFQQAGQQWGAYAADIQRRQDIAETEEQFNKVAEDDNNEFAKFSQLRGKAAVDAHEAFDKSQQQRYRVALERAKNDQQRQWLKEKLADRRVQVIGQAAAHKEGQLAVQRYGVAQQSTKQAVDDVVKLGPSEKNLQAVRDRATEQAQLAGVDPEPRVKLAISDAHVGVAQRYIDNDKPGEAVKWLADHQQEMDPDAFAKANRVARGRFVEWGARQLDQNVPDIRQRMGVIEEWKAAGRINGDEAESARRHVLQLEDVRQKQQAEEQQVARQQAEAWLRANPLLSLDQAPQLAQEVIRTGAMPRAVQSTVPGYRESLNRIPMQVLQQMSDAQLDNVLSRGLSPSDAREFAAVVRGDFTTYTTEKRIKDTLVGLIGPKPAGDAGDAWELQRARFDRMVDDRSRALQQELRRKPEPNEIQERILDPMLRDKIKFDDNWVFDDPEMPLMSAILRGRIPTDEAGRANYGEAGSVYVDTPMGPHFLRSMPVEDMKRLAADWEKAHPGESLPASEMSRQYLLQARMALPKPMQGADSQVETLRKMGMFGPATLVPSDFGVKK